MTDPASPPLPSDPLDDEMPEPKPLRRLRRLVTVLILVLILGMIAVSGALVIRLAQFGGPGSDPETAAISTEALALPPGERIVALGRSGAELLIATRAETGEEWLRSFDAVTGEPLSATRIRREHIPSRSGDHSPG